MKENIPAPVAGATRIILDLNFAVPRLDSVLLSHLRSQTEHPELKTITRAQFKELFAKGGIQVKGQNAKANSGLASGRTYIDILFKIVSK
jgi:hypothetical protein